MYEGWYKRPRRILEMVEQGQLSLIDAGIHDYLCARANPFIDSDAGPPGVVFASAGAIERLCGGLVAERSIRRSLEQLERVGLI